MPEVKNWTYPTAAHVGRARVSSTAGHTTRLCPMAWGGYTCLLLLGISVQYTHRSGVVTSGTDTRSGRRARLVVLPVRMVAKLCEINSNGANVDEAATCVEGGLSLASKCRVERMIPATQTQESGGLLRIGRCFDFCGRNVVF